MGKIKEIFSVIKEEIESNASDYVALILNEYRKVQKS